MLQRVLEMNRNYILKCFVICVFLPSLCLGASGTLDFWDEEPRLFTVAKDGQDLYHDITARQKVNYNSPYFKAGHADKQVGDLSIVYDAAKAGNTKPFGFVSSLWGDVWQLDNQFSLNMFIKIKSDNSIGGGTVTLVDKAGNKAEKKIKHLDKNRWQQLSFRLKDFKADNGFDYSNVKECRFNLELPEDAIVWLDGINFSKAGKYVGVTDKTLAQRMEEERKTRPARLLNAYEAATKTMWGSPYVNYFAKLYLGKDIEQANAGIMEELQKPDVLDDPWSLFHTPMLCRLYIYFSSKSEIFPGRLKPAVEEKLLEVLWERTYLKNDIHWAKQSTWWLDGSENHDINAKACNLVSARIFMNEPKYKDRIYPDYGFGGGYHYAHAGFYGSDIDPETRHGGGRANLSDGKKYNAEDHYYAWLKFLKEYFTERAKRGFFVERAASGYMHHTLNFVDLVYMCSGDDELKQIVGNFFDLVWADWAQESISGLRGGMKARHNYEGGYAAITNFMRYYLGGPGNGSIWYYWSLINDYHLPPVIMKTALDRQGLGCFEYKSRGVGEEENVWPRPFGTERTLLCDTESRFLKYSYVTPDYVLGCQMEHPAAVHSHLSLTKRWQGMIFAQSPESRVVTVGLNVAGKDEPGYVKSKKGYDMHTNYRSVQSKSVMITQQARRVFQVNPEWFPAGPMYERGMGVYVGKDWDQMVEQNGWVFLKKGNAYAAIKPILWDEEYEKEKSKAATGVQKFFNSAQDDATVKIKDGAYTWACDHKVLKLEDKFSPVIIEAGRKADYPTIEDFIKDIVDNPIALYKTVVPGYNVLVYTGCGDAKEIVFNAATMEMPTVGGEYIDYSYPMTFDSPYMKSEYKSGKIKMKFGDEELYHDFTGTATNSDKASFDKASEGNWQEVFSDTCTEDWTEKWFLDGEIGMVKTSEVGMQLTAGPQLLNDAHHVVLWTKDSFTGDVKIEYDYTRLDFESHCVNILYIQATGSGKGPYVADITKWNEFRQVPAMNVYYDHMNTYHISYAALPGTEKEYIRARRYMPEKSGLEGTDLEPDYYPKGLFEPGVKHKITVIKKDRDIYMRIKNSEQTYYCHFTNTDLPIVKEGRIGLRHMFTRSSVYKNFQVSVLQTMEKLEL